MNKPQPPDATATAVSYFQREWFRDMLGTVSDYSLREGHSSVAIIRSTAKQVPPGSHVYMFATDGSRAAAVAFCTLCNQ